jgi:uncharacterized protein (TIGR02117 family)
LYDAAIDHEVSVPATIRFPRAALLLTLLAGCSHPQFPPCDDPDPTGPTAWVVDHGWHTEIGIPADEVTGPLAIYRTLFPGARTLMFGFGKRTFITAKVQTASELVMGPLPGPAVVQVTALNVPPGQAFPGRTIRLALPPGGADRLSDFLWQSIAQSEAGGPRLVGDGLFPGSMFYAASKGYNLTYTCNTFTADGLRQAGLPVDDDVIFASGTLHEVARITGACGAPG